MAKANGIVKENQIHEEEILNLRNELSSVTVKLQQYSESVSDLNAELQRQKQKNDVSVHVLPFAFSLMHCVCVGLARKELESDGRVKCRGR